MILYAESSAVLAWLLDEEDSGPVRNSLSRAELIVASRLTLVECHRVLQRGLALGELSQAATEQLQDRLESAAGHWALQNLDSGVLDRASRIFPHEPIRTLDALHLASALQTRELIPAIRILSLDHRLLASAKALGFETVPR